MTLDTREEWERLGQEQTELQQEFKAAPMWKRFFLIWPMSLRNSEIIKRRQELGAKLWERHNA